MSDQENIQKLIAALEIFGKVPDKAAINHANAWLQDFQHSPEAWTTCNVILTSAEAPDTARTFAAQTFRSKVTYDLHQLNPSQVDFLKSALISALQNFANGPRNILVQISLALSGLALQLKEWAPTAVEELIETLGGDPITVPALLQFLAVLPDEINSNTRIPIPDDEYKEGAAALLTNNSTRITELLTLYLQAPGITSAIQNLIFEVLCGWVMAGELSAGALTNTPLFAFAFDALQSDELFDGAVKLICDIIHETQELDDNVEAIRLIVPRLVALQPQLIQAKDDPEKMRLFCRLFSDAGEIYRMLIFQHPETFLPLIQIISECAAYPDLDVVSVTFPFWYKLALCLGKRRSTPPMIIEAYQNLLATLMGHIHFPADIETMSAQDTDELRSFRHDIGDVLKDCTYVLGADYTLQQSFNLLTLALSRGHTGGIVSWQEVEAPLFCMRALGGEIDWNNPPDMISKVMAVFPSLPDHPRVRYAATMLLARYTQWVEQHPETIPDHLTFISGSFEHADLDVVSAAGCALKYLCKDCKSHLIPFMDQLYQFLTSVGSKLQQDDKVAIYEAIAYVIASMSMEDAAATLRRFSEGIFASLHAGITKLPPNMKIIKDGLEQLEHMLGVVRGFGEELPRACQNTAHETWAVIDAVILKLGDIPDVCDRVTRVLRLGIRFFDVACLPLIPTILARLTSRFENTGFANYLWSIGNITQRFALEEDPTIRSALQEAYERVTVKCALIFGQSSIASHSDVVEDYLSIIIPLIEQSPDILFLSPAFPTVFSILAASLQLFQSDPVFHSLGLIRAILDHDCMRPGSQPLPPRFPLYAEAIQDAVLKDGLLLVGNLFAGLFGHFVPEMLSGVITAVRILTEFWPAQMQQWVPTVFEQLPVSTVLTPARNQFLNEFGSALALENLDKLKPAISNLQRAVLRAKDRKRPLDR